MPSATGQTLSEPLTSTLPVFGVSLQVTATVTGVVVRAVTLKDAEPLQVTLESVLLADKVME